MEITKRRKPLSRKARMELVNLSFVEQMAFGLEEGIKDGRTETDWYLYGADKWGEYHAKILRHLLEAGRTSDYAEKMAHCAAIANDAMILSHIAYNMNIGNFFVEDDEYFSK